MGFAEDKFFDFLRKNMDLLGCINVNEMLNHLRGVFTIPTGEQLERNLDREGNTNAVFHFLNNLRKRDNWVNHLLQALWKCEHFELYGTLRDEYRLHRPKGVVWEPDPPPYSPPSLPPNPCDNSQLDSLRGCISLPIQLNPSSPEPLPVPPVAPSPSQVQPEQVSRRSHQPQESGDPSTQPRAPTSQSLPAARDVALPDEVDTKTSADSISKAPVPETSPFPSVVDSNGVLSEATNPQKQYPPVASSFPAREDIAMTLQEKAENPEVVHSVEQYTSVVNAVNDLPHTPMNRKVVGSDASSPSRSLSEDDKAWTAPQQREVPGYSQDTSNPPPGQQYAANAINKHYPKESVPNPVTSAPSQHPSGTSSESGVKAAAGPQHRQQQPTYESSVQHSSCRPTNDVEKPGVLVSGAGFADFTRETDQAPALSRMPELEISVDELSNKGSQFPGSSKSPATRASKGSPTPLDEPNTSTPKNSSSGSSPKKRPEESEDPRRASGSVRRREQNRQEPEENSFELSNDLSFYRLQFNENPSVDLMDGNSAPQQKTTKTPETRETGDREASQQKEKSRENNLHDPLVIASAVVVCIGLYIIWLKYKN
ncbi:unnamed protein product [Staurois parvus]|uniref:Caspase recruitment domain-containing protein n=1 Tax=Staurois parvus TaxID=386267 RepID=A0ABN9BW29_9NEOB|nr:unnamed protein product [Staurois parvus]